MGFFAFIIIGLIAGLLARAIVPGKQSMGLLATMLLGMAGSVLGGFVGSLISPDRTRTGPFGVHASGFIMSTLGAIVVLLLYTYFAGRRGRGAHP
jgi:uncharacterized membrane protein YeaQ/YmgE (transglycosylase-associated protein family)